MMKTRRNFIKKAASGAAALPFLSPLTLRGSSVKAETPKICFFTKDLQWLGFDDLAVVLKEAGYDGADFTVRKGGHIEPENVVRDLPKAVRAMQQHGLTVPMVASGVQSAEEPGIDDYLKALSENGVKYYRMGYLDYNYKIPIEDNIKAFREIFAALAEKNSMYNVCGVYQNHSGTRLGASIWDLDQALEKIDPNLVGCQFDIRHATYEGGKSWENDFRLIAPHIRTTVAKDFYWIKDEKGTWRHQNVPMGEGMVDFKKYFELYKAMNIQEPMTIHAEYNILTKDEENLPKTDKMKIAIRRLKHDVDYINSFF
jgi:L-ribulose-5-phosphate 3-epimerase